jgi:macrolide transport system ATP-binding/permease protein
MAEDAHPQSVQDQVGRVLAQRHGQQDFMVLNRETQLRQASQASDMMRLVLTAIASISLLVGGVGVMNTMLVAVSERTSEIGIRMAVGARSADVQTQFLVESMVLCGLGGLLGLALSCGVVWGINLFEPDLQASLSWGAMATAFAVSSAIGLVFGGVPARQASRMSPVAALSRE